MSSAYRNQQPILPYPSWLSLGQLLVALIEQSSGVTLPEGWDHREPYYLQEDVPALCEAFKGDLEVSINGAEPADWLLRELEDFERGIAEELLAYLISQPETRHTINTLKTIAVERARAGSNQQGGQPDDAE